MRTVEMVAKKARELKRKGLTEKEISDELHLSQETVTWLLTKQWDKKKKKTADVRIGWRSIAIFPSRTRMAASIMADVILEELGEDNYPDAVVGIAINALSLATFVAEELGTELVVYRNFPDNRSKGTFSSVFAGVKGKKVVIVDDVIGTGDTMTGAINTLKKEGAKPLLCVVLVNKTTMDEIAGVRLRGLVRAYSVE